jgi:hypothetical protein
MSDELDWDFSDPDDAKAENPRRGALFAQTVPPAVTAVISLGRSLRSCTRLGAACRLVAEIPWTMTCPVASPAITLGRPPVSPGRFGRVCRQSIDLANCSESLGRLGWLAERIPLPHR